MEKVVLAHVHHGAQAANVSAIPPGLSAQVANAAGHVASEFPEAFLAGVKFEVQLFSITTKIKHYKNK